MTAASRVPVCRIVAGPNGAGKTTFALNYLPLVAPGTAFVNADLIAAGLSPLAPEQQTIAASRLFLQQIGDHVAAGRDFAFETTLAGRAYLRLVRRLRSAGWRVELFSWPCRPSKCRACAWPSGWPTAATRFRRTRLRAVSRAV